MRRNTVAALQFRMNSTRPGDGRSAIRRTLLFTGRVQGVGFRYTAKRLSRGFQIVGTVRNLDDGRVELVAEGDPAEIDRFQEALAREFQGYITDTRSTDSTSTSEFSDFQIRR